MIKLYPRGDKQIFQIQKALQNLIKSVLFVDLIKNKY